MNADTYHNIVHTEHGIISKDERSEFQKKSREHNPAEENTGSILGI